MPSTRRPEAVRHRGHTCERGLQLDLFILSDNARWSMSRPFAASRLRDRALKHLETVRRHFPELNDVTIRIGRTRSRHAHAWASMDPDQPTVWIKPGALTLFTVAHEFVHLLQARGLAPGGEKAADLYALARDPGLIDKPPSYLRVPRILFTVEGLPRVGAANLLHRTAVESIREAPGRPRTAVRRFESKLSVAGVRA
jgi:hypothetical protein